MATAALHLPTRTLARFHWAWRVMPSLTDFAFLLPILLLFTQMPGLKTLLGDGDTGWHIRTGEWILANHRVPTTDMFSFTKAGQPWFAWEWAWDVVFACVHQYSGLAGVVFINILILGFVSAALFRLTQRACGNDILAIALTMLAVGGSTIHWLARPHLISWLIFLVWAHIVGRAREGNVRWLWTLPVLTVIWTNLHGSFFLGIAMLVVYAIGGSSVPFLLCATACTLASLLNPYGWQLHHHVLTYLLDSKQLDRIAEYQSLSFRSPGAWQFELMLALGAFTIFWSLARKRWSDAIWLVLWTHLALTAVRNVPFYLFVAAPLVARMIQGLATEDWARATSRWMRRFGSSIAHAGVEFRPVERLPRLHLASILPIACLLLLLRTPAASDKLAADFDPHHFPVAAMAAISGPGVANIFTHDQWGDYAIYRMYPHCRVYVDGRSDLYGNEFEENVARMMHVPWDWERRLNRLPADFALVEADSPWTSVLKQSSRWKLIFDDGIALVFRRQPAAPAQDVKLSSVWQNEGNRSATPTVRRSAVPGLGPNNKERRS